MLFPPPDGGDTMPRFRRGRCLRLSSYFAAFGTLLYLLVSYDPVPLPSLSRTKPPPEYESRPTYEVSTLYRQQADHTFEKELDLSLQAFEERVRRTLPRSESNLLANRTIWQITSPRLADEWMLWISQWRDNNEDWAYSLFDKPGTPEDLMPIFEAAPAIDVAINDTSPVMREDLIRYLTLWYYGGFYAAIDTWDRVAMRHCQPIINAVSGAKSISLMIGVDVDEPYLSPKTMQEWRWARNFGFGQSVVWAPKRFDPILRKAIVRTVSHLRIHKTLPVANFWRTRFPGKIDYASEVSGSGMFTDLVLETLSKTLHKDHPLRDREAGLERRVTWKKFRQLKHLIWIEPRQAMAEPEEELRGLAVLPINIWGNGQEHSHSGSGDADEACVNRVHSFRPRKHWKNSWFGP